MTASRLATISRRLTATALAALTVIGMSACGSQNAATTATSGNNSASQSADGAFPVTIKHALGETTIQSQPKRVAAIGWGADDALVALGIAPVTLKDNGTFGKTVDGFLPWTKDALDKMNLSADQMPTLHDESDDIDAEAIAAAEPDLIIGPYSGVTEDQYKTLSKIAPTVPQIKAAWSEPWRDEIEVVAQAVGKEDEGKQLISDLENTITSEAAKYPDIKGKTAAVLYMDASKLSSFSLYNTLDTRAQFLNDFGFETPDSVKKISENASTFYADVSSENADQYADIDVIVTYGTPDLLDAIQKDPLLSKIPAVANGSVVVIDTSTEMANALSPTALSIPATAAEYAKMLGEAAAKVK